MKWQKQLIWMCIILILIHFTFAYPECQRTEKATDIPCIIISSYGLQNCSVNGTISNSTNVVSNITWKNYTANYCYALFNITTLGTYQYSGKENGIINVIGDNEMILALILIPISVMFLFLYWSSTLNEDQEALKWFMRMLSLVMIFVLYGAANIAISLNPAYSVFQSLFDISIIGVIFWTILAVLFVYIIYKIFWSFKQQKKEKFQRGEF